MENLDEQTLVDCYAAYNYYDRTFIIENGHVVKMLESED